MAGVDRIPIRVQMGFARTVFGLPAPVRRRLAGRRIERDGQRLDTDTQLLLRLLQLQGTVLTMPEVDVARRMTDRGAPVAGGPVIGSVDTRDITISGADGVTPARRVEPGREIGRAHV